MFQQLLVKIAQALDNAHIPYMVIGGQAVLLYGEPRLTKDIDITLGVGADRLPNVVAVIDVLDMKILVENPEEFVAKTMVLPAQDTKSGIRIDLIFSYSSYEQQAIARSRSVSFTGPDGGSVRIASLEDIVIHKVIAGRPRDIEDVKSILLKNPSYDIAYIESVLSDFDTGLDAQFLFLFRSIITEIK
jgi:hypothetical protein